ncbi:MAG: hypothetical protein WBH82_02305, partial [Arcanobacterium sp.]
MKHKKRSARVPSHGLKQATKRSSGEMKRVSKRARRSAQAQISYEAMMESGVCYVGGKKYSITLKLSDIDYQLAPADVQEGIVEKYAQFLNGHLSGQHVQIS